MNYISRKNIENLEFSMWPNNQRKNKRPWE